MRRLLSVILFASALCAQTSNYPGSVDTLAQLFASKDNVQTTLTSAMAIADSVAIVKSTNGWTANMIAYICDGSTSSTGICPSSFEELLVTSVVNSSTLAVTRGIGGTVAVAHASGRTVTNAITASYHTAMASAMMAVQNALGANLSNITAKLPLLFVSTYNYAAQTPGGTIGAGSTVIAMNPCAPGLLPGGTTYEYISAGTGTAEAVPVTGGTCAVASPPASGTVIVTVANSHSGAWTITSATGGVSECLNVASASGGGRCTINPSSPPTLHAKVTFPGGLYTLDGSNSQARYSVTRASDYPNGDLFYWDTHASAVQISNLGVNNDTVANQTSGAAFHVYSVDWAGLFNPAVFTDVWILGGYEGWLFEKAAAGKGVNANYFYGTHTNAAMHLNPNGVTNMPSGVEWVNSYFNGGTTGTGIIINGADGFLFANSFIFGFATAVSIQPDNGASTYLGVVKFEGNRFDGQATDGISVENPNGKFLKYVTIANNTFSNGVANSRWAVDVNQSFASAQTSNIAVTGNHFYGWGASCVIVGATSASTQIQIEGNSSQDCNQNNVGSTPYAQFSGSGVTYVGNSQAGSNLYYHLGFFGAAVNGNFTGNDFSAAPSTASVFVNPGTGVSGALFSNNKGISDVTGTVTSAATLPWVFNPNFTVSGSTNVTAVTGCPAGATGTITATAATLKFTAAASIGNSFVLVQNVPAGYYCDGTKVWLAGQSPTVSNTYNYIATEGGANNAITGTLTGVTTGDGLCVTVQLAHTLQVGANTFALNGGAAVAIKSHLNTANNIATAYAATGRWTGCYNSTGPVWMDMGQ